MFVSLFLGSHTGLRWFFFFFFFVDFLSLWYFPLLSQIFYPCFPFLSFLLQFSFSSQDFKKKNFLFTWWWFSFLFSFFLFFFAMIVCLSSREFILNCSFSIVCFSLGCLFFLLLSQLIIISHFISRILSFDWCYFSFFVLFEWDVRVLVVLMVTLVLPFI